MIPLTSSLHPIISLLIATSSLESFHFSLLISSFFFKKIKNSKKFLILLEDFNHFQIFKREHINSS